MLLFLHNFSIHSGQALTRAGYKPHPYKKREYILEESSHGRFHAKIIDKMAFEVHYDCYIDGKHVSGFPLPIKHNTERKRIFKNIRKFQKESMGKERFWKLNNRYANREITFD
jgi:hypothetical protein